jgi:hypothetical protein
VVGAPLGHQPHLSHKAVAAGWHLGHVVTMEPALDVRAICRNKDTPPREFMDSPPIEVTKKGNEHFVVVAVLCACFSVPELKQERELATWIASAQTRGAGM